MRGFATRLLEDPDTLREQVEAQARAEREPKPWMRNAREAASARERLVKLEAVEDNYRDQQAEGLISMAKLREKLDGVREEREDLEARIASLADGESRLRQLEELPDLVEEYLRDLPGLVRRELTVRGYETIAEERTPDNSLGIYRLTPARIRHLGDGELAEKRLAAQAACAARLRVVYHMLGLRAGAHADGTLDITVASAGGGTAPNPETKGVMPCDKSGSPSTTSTPT